MKNILPIIVLLFSFDLSAQTANIILQNEDSTTFKLTINNIVQHENYLKRIKVNYMKGNMPYNIKLEFKDDTLILKKNIFLIDEGLTHIYFINKNQISLKKVVPASTYAVKDIQEVDYIANKNIPSDTPAKDTAQVKDTVYIPPFESYYHLEDYTGKIGCPFPIKIEQLTTLRGVIMEQTLEESKLEKIKIAVEDIDSACIMVDQVKELIVLFEYEETRLDFAKFISSYLFDIDNVGKLSEVFNFENSMEELKKHLGI